MKNHSIYPKRIQILKTQELSETTKWAQRGFETTQFEMKGILYKGERQWEINEIKRV
jgi:hypothetical protein